MVQNGVELEIQDYLSSMEPMVFYESHYKCHLSLPCTCKLCMSYVITHEYQHKTSHPDCLHNRRIISWYVEDNSNGTTVIVQ